MNVHAKRALSFLLSLLLCLALFPSVLQTEAAAGQEPNTIYTPFIMKQPDDQTVTEGEDAVFQIRLCGTGLGVHSIIWQVRTPSNKNWVNVNNKYIRGYKTATMTVPATMARNGYEYRCVVKNSKGSATSSAARLTVTPDTGMPRITRQPSDSWAQIGEKATLDLEASGDHLSYQWQVKTANGWVNVNNKYITGAKTAKMRVPMTEARDGKEYRCIVSNGAGSVTSRAAKLVKFIPGIIPSAPIPTITKQPQDVTAAPGTKVVFAVEVSGNQLSYQWKVKTSESSGWVNVNNKYIDGAKTAALTVPATMARDGYQYCCFITNSLGSVSVPKTVVSNVVTLTVKN